MVNIHISSKGLAEIIGQFDRAALSLQDMRAALDAAADTFYELTAEVFASQGPGWEPLARSTVKKKGHGRILYESGDLQDSWTGGAGRHLARGGNWIQLGSGNPYALFHEEGFHNVLTDTSVTARPVLEGGLENEVMDAFVRVILERLDREL